MVGKHAFNEFVFDSELPVHKHDSLVETEEEQVAALLKGKSAFSAGGQWCTLGFALLGSNAILRAQKEQLRLEAEGTAAVRAKKIKDATEKLGKAQAVLDKFRRKEKMTAPDWKVVIAFVLPRYKANEPVSKCQTIGKIKDKLQELEKAKEVTWDSFVEDELGKSRAAMPPLEETGNTAADAAELELEDPDDNGHSSIVGHPEEV